MKQIKLVLDKDVIERYNKYYFEQHPRARKVPIEHPQHPSINVWFILPRMQMNALKQKWKDFIVWWINDLGYQNMKLENFEMTFSIFHPTKRRLDPDNMTPKFILDGFTEAGFIADDDDKHLHSLTLKCDYSPNHPRTEILVKIL